ncbi:MAG: hypothetical protein QNK32_05215 [Porticoccus sp.]|nr:hypothetical protein [Porticoccus sp.]
MASELVQRLIAANEGSQQAVMGSDIFYKAAERIDVLEKALGLYLDAQESLENEIFRDEPTNLECVKTVCAVAKIRANRLLNA